MDKSYGARYHETQGSGYMNTADIAKLMRADLKAAGELPADLKVSVTVENYSMGRSINIRAEYRPEFWAKCEGTFERLRDDGATDHVVCQRAWHQDAHEVLTVEGQRVQRVLDSIHGAYNYDGSDVMTDYFDVNYYGHAEIESREASEGAAQERARKAQLRADGDERKTLIALLADRTIYKPGRLRQWRTEKLREFAEKVQARNTAAS